MQKKKFCQRVLIYSAFLMASFLWHSIELPAQAVEAGVEKIRALIERGNYLMNRGQFQPAIDVYQQVLDLEPNNPYARANIVLAHNNWGIFYFHKGDLDLAKAEWDKALAIDSNDRNAKNNLLVLKRRLSQLGKSMDDLSKEKTAKATAKAEEKKKEEPGAAPSGVVLLTPQKKQDEQPPPPAETTGVVLLTPQKKQDAQAGATEAPAEKPPAQEVKAPAAEAPEAAHTAPVEVAKPIETPSAGRTRADDEAEAFRRMTSTGGGSYSGSEHGAAPPAISTFKPVPRRRVGSPTSFLDDPGPSKPAPAEAEQPISTPQTSSPPPTQTVTSSSFQTQEEAPAPEEKPARKKKHAREPVADATNPEWSQPSRSPSLGGESSGGMGNVDSTLTKLETKIYGQPRPQPSVIKRLERMEIDSFGRASVGSITERIDKLKKMYNVID
jgi:Tetratricopeptide repeat